MHIDLAAPTATRSAHARLGISSSGFKPSGSRRMTDVLSRLAAAVAERYSITRELGRGGMATVYLAEDVRHHRKVAIKVLHPELSAVLGGERFLKEIELTANLQHPHILPLFDSGTAEGLLYYVMPFVEGETLRVRLARERQLPVPDAIRIASDVADALEYAHKRGVVHRDIKPENILLQDGRPLVADFGIALAVQQAGGERMTQTGLSLGTPQYMSPEQATGERDIDARSDIYSLGAVAYEMLTGEPPFTGPTSQAIVAKVITTDPGSIAARRKSVPSHVEDAVLTALEKVPADRFASAAAFAHALADASGSTQRSTTTARRGAATKRAYDWRVIGGTTAAALLLGGVIGWMAHRPERASQGKVTFAIKPDSGERLATACCSSAVAISPDGRRIVYGIITGSTRTLVTRTLDEVEAHRIPGTDGGRNPAFSPDGEWIVFQQGSEATGGISSMKKLPVAGGAPTVIAPLPSDLIGITWMADGTIVYSMLEPAPQGLFRVSADGGTPEEFARPDSAAGEASYRFPSRIPDSDLILFNVVPREGGVTAADVAALTPSGRVTRLQKGFAPKWARGFMFFMSTDGSLKAQRYDLGSEKLTGPMTTIMSNLPVRGVPLDFDVSANGHAIGMGGQFEASIRVGENEISARTVPTRFDGLIHVDNPRFSPDGKRISLAAFVGGFHNLYVLDPAAGTSERISFGGEVEHAEWSRDGAELIYVKDGKTIMAQAPDRRGGERMIWKGNGQIIGRFSAFGPWIAFVVRSQASGTGGSDLMVFNTDSSTARHFIASSFAETSPTISPDGKWLAYVGDETGRDEVYVAAFPDASRGRQIVSNAGGTEPVWGRKGNALFYRARNRQVIQAAYETGDRFVVTNRTPLTLTAGDVSADGADYDRSPTGNDFVFSMTQTGRARVLVTLGAIPAR